MLRRGELRISPQWNAAVRVPTLRCMTPSDILPFRRPSSAHGHAQPSSRAGEGGGTGIVMMNLGGPATLDEVEPFLLRLFADKEIIQLPWQDVLGKFIAEGAEFHGQAQFNGLKVGGTFWFNRAIFQQNAIRHILVRHEQAAVHAAEGDRKSTRLNSSHT